MHEGAPRFSAGKAASVGGKNTISRSRKTEQGSRLLLGLFQALVLSSISVPQPAAPPDALRSQLLFSRITEAAGSRERCWREGEGGWWQAKAPTAPRMSSSELQPHQTIKHKNHRVKLCWQGCVSSCWQARSEPCFCQCCQKLLTKTITIFKATSFTWTSFLPKLSQTKVRLNALVDFQMVPPPQRKVAQSLGLVYRQTQGAPGSGSYWG